MVDPCRSHRPFREGTRSKDGVEGKRKVRCRSGESETDGVGFEWSSLLGGRGLGAGEKSLKTEEGTRDLFRDPVRDRGTDASKESRRVPSLDVEDPERPLEEIYIGKGRTIRDDPRKYPSKVSVGFFENVAGGWAGGEAGLWNLRKEIVKEKRLGSLEVRKNRLMSAPRIMKLPQGVPLLMPGMNAKVINAKSQYFGFIGIVQRVSDGQVALLFEGGNWDKLLTFPIQDLERSKTGPPMVNPKSGVLLDSITEEEGMAKNVS